jgi:predicted dehydrogenase
MKRVAFVGYGSIAKKHLEILSTLCSPLDITLVRSQKIDSEVNKSHRIVHQVEHALELGVDLAFVTSPSNLHIQQAVKFLSENVPTFIEKPLSNSLNMINKHEELLSKSSDLALVGYVLRYNNVLLAAKKMLSSGEFGKVCHVRASCSSFLPDWRPGKDYKETPSANFELGGGVLLELSHEIDYLVWIFGGFDTIYASLRNTKILNVSVEDIATIIFSKEKYFDVSLNIDFCNSRIRRECEVITQKGTLLIDILNNKIHWKDHSGIEKLWNFQNAYQDMFEKQMRHFLNVANGLSKPNVTISSSINVLKIIEKVRLSNAQRKEVII